MAARQQVLTPSGAGTVFSPAVPALLIAATLWGATYVVTKFALADLGPFTVLFLRLVVGAVVLYPFARRQGFHLGLAARRRFVLFGLTGMTLHLGFEIVGLEFTSASSAALVIASAPAVTVAFSIVFLRERLTLLRWVGIALSIVGVVLITGAQVSDGYPLGWLGNLLVFAGVVTWGMFTVQGKRMASGYSALVSTTAGTASAAVMLVPVVVVEVLVTGVPSFDAASLGAVLYLGVGASGIAYGLWNLALRHVDASVAGPFINLVPVIGVALALLIGETMSLLQFVGGLTVVAGVWMSHRGAAA
jgi:drug/metabolite transporter (DMT)-like permease